MTAPGTSLWIPLNYMQVGFGVSLFIIPDSGTTLSCKVEHTPDELDDWKPCLLARTTTVATLTAPNHGATAADSLFVKSAGAPFDSPFDTSSRPQALPVATVVDASNLTYTVANSGAAAGSTLAQYMRLRVFPHATLVAITSRTDGNYAFPPMACRLNVASITGAVDFLVVQGMGR